MKRSGMAGKNLLRKALPSPGQQDGLCLSQPRRMDSNGDTGTRGKEQAPAATTKSAGAKRRCPAECRQSFAEQAAKQEAAERKCGRQRVAGSRRCPRPLRFKKRHHSREKKRKQAAGSKQGRRGKEMRAARQRGPVFRRRRRAVRGAARRGPMPPSPALFPNQSTNIETGI
jgi:hypothetical protein